MQLLIRIRVFAAANYFDVVLSPNPSFERIPLKQFSNGSWLIFRVDKYFTCGSAFSSSHKRNNALMGISQHFMQGGGDLRSDTVNPLNVHFIILIFNDGLSSFSAHLNGFE